MKNLKKNGSFTGIYSQSDFRFLLIVVIDERRNCFLESMRDWHFDNVSTYIFILIIEVQDENDLRQQAMTMYNGLIIDTRVSNSIEETNTVKCSISDEYQFLNIKLTNCEVNLLTFASNRAVVSEH